MAHLSSDSHDLPPARIRIGMGSGMRAPVDGFHSRQVCPTGAFGGFFSVSYIRAETNSVKER